MSLGTYRIQVIGAILSSFLLGMHMPVIHDVLGHGGRTRWDVLIASAVLAVIAITCGWRLLAHRR